jgi:DNA-binding NtrC family response regulator
VESELFGHERGAFTGAERLRRGRFELASGGTVFLDEVGDLPQEVQVKLLRVLQEGTIERVGSAEPLAVDVRVLAATHRDLLAEVRAGHFREDLYYRLAVVTVELPPLRRRREDIRPLVDHFRRKHAATGSTPRDFSREAMDLLLAYDYPGNVRELENVVQRALVLARSELVTSADLPPQVRGERPEPPAAWRDEALPLEERVAALERDALGKALARAGGNQSRAAQLLAISERVLRYKLAKYGLKPASADEPRE